MKHMKISGFAEACYNTNTIEELIEALASGPDPIDMQDWNLTPELWTEAVKTALLERIKDIPAYLLKA
jgi:hypothetical protein